LKISSFMYLPMHNLRITPRSRLGLPTHPLSISILNVSIQMIDLFQ
jgi:hypothetical protein